MKRVALLFIIAILAAMKSFSQGVAINNSELPADNSAILDISSELRGILIPRMSQSNRNSIPSPATGLMIYQTDYASGYYYFDGSFWVAVGKGTLGINDLKDGIYDISSLYLGRGTGINDDGSNKNVAAGDSSLTHNTSGSNNTAIGYRAMYSSTTANSNTAVGYQSIHSNTTGNSNAAFGSLSLTENTSGASNTAAGTNALRHNTEGGENTAVGSMASYENTLGYANVSLGVHADYFNQKGSFNTIIGYSAGNGTSVHDKSGNVFLGHKAGYYETGSNKLYIENSDATAPLLYGEFDNNLIRINGNLDLTGTLSGVGIDDLMDGKKTTTSTYLGNFAGFSNSASTSRCVAIGDSSLYANISGINNNAIGYGSLRMNTGNRNDATGCQALYWNTSGDDNTAHGYRSLYANDTGMYNTGIGSESNYYNNGGSRNTIMGYKAGRGSYDHIKSGNVFLGYLAGYNDTVDNNTAVGTEALYGNISGEKNTANGYRALYTNVSGEKNTSTGYQSSYLNETGSCNTVFGFNANGLDTAGSNNTIVGCEAGRGSVLHRKTGNVMIGYRAGMNDTTSNKLYIANSASASPLIWGDFANDTVRINGVLDIAAIYHFPVTDGNPGQYLGTDGNGALGWGSGGATDIDELSDGKSDLTSLYLGNNAGSFNSGLYNYNVGIGIGVLKQNTTGEQNTGIGYHALAGVYENDYNTAVGYEALKLVSMGNSNSAFGCRSLYQLLGGGYNTAIGYYAGNGISFGSNNTFIGYRSGETNSDISGSVFIGYQSGYNETTSNKLYIENSNSSSPLIWGDFANDIVRINGTLDIASVYQFPTVDGNDGQTLLTNGAGTLSWGSTGANAIDDLSDAIADNNNLFLGTDAGVANTGQLNIGIGKQTLFLNQNGSRNTALGYNALRLMINDTNNTGMGAYALYNSNGGSNSAFGTYALSQIDFGGYNTAVGQKAGYDVMDGDNNTFVGCFTAGSGIYTRSISGSVFLGYSAGANELSSNKLYIENSDSDDPLIWGDFANDSVKINGTFNIRGEYSFPDTIGTYGQVLISDGEENIRWKKLTYEVGDWAHGGVVFWVDASGEHGLVCAKDNQSLNIAWFAGTFGATRSTGNGPYSGEMNTAIIISSHVAIGDNGFPYAAILCAEYDVTQAGKHYADWYLPSKRELELMYINKATINTVILEHSGEVLDDVFYWSSTESDSNNAWAQRFSDGYQNDVDKSLLTYVRAIRAF